MKCTICWNLQKDATKMCKRDKKRCAEWMETEKCGKEPKKCSGNHPENCNDCRVKILHRECLAYRDECQSMSCKVPSSFCPEEEPDNCEACNAISRPNQTSGAGLSHAGFWDLCRKQQKMCTKICKNEGKELTKGKNPYKNKKKNKKNKKNKN